MRKRKAAGTRKPKTAKRPTTVKHPAVDESYKQDFQQYAYRSSLQLTLSQAMIEMLSATADGVVWDRTRESTYLKPDNMFATEAALIKRGLIRNNRHKRRRAQDGIDRTKDFWAQVDAFVELTPAGEAVVQLLKVTGIFVEADSAIIRKHSS